MRLCLSKVSDTVQAVVSMVTNWAFLHWPTAQTGGKWQVSLRHRIWQRKKRFYIFNFSPEQETTTEEEIVVCASSKPEERGARGICVGWSNERNVRTFGILGCLNIVLMTSYIRFTPYIQHQNTHSNPVRVLQRPAVALRIIWVITSVCSASRSLKPSILRACFFFLLSK